METLKNKYIQVQFKHSKWSGNTSGPEVLGKGFGPPVPTGRPCRRCATLRTGPPSLASAACLKSVPVYQRTSKAHRLGHCASGMSRPEGAAVADLGWPQNSPLPKL